MNTLNFFVENPLLLIMTGLITFFIRYYKNIASLFPSAPKSLERLKKSKDFSNPKQKKLNEFLDLEIEYHNFYNATGLVKNKRNSKLLSHYKKINDKITWFKFKRIIRHIKNPDKFKSIETKKYRFISFLIIGFWGILALSFFTLTIYYCIKFKDNSSFYSVLISLYFATGCSQLIMMHRNYELKLVRQYDTIIRSMK